MSAKGIDFKPGDIVAAKYLIKKELGRGGFGVVYQVEHLHIPGQRLALKILYPEVARDLARRNAFIREVQVGMRLVHPSIVIVRDAAATDELTFYTMDYVDGRPIDRILEDDGPPSVERALEWVRQVCTALSVAHAERIIHRDIKPANILVAKQGVNEIVKVLDFGIAKVLEQTGGTTLSDAGGFMGTPEYLSPEQAQGKKSIDARADIYSLGAVLYHLLAGRLPFVSESLTGYIFQHAFESAPAFSIVAPGRVIPASAEAIARKALEKDPANRFQSADEMAAAISASLIEASTGVITAAGGRVTSTSETGVSSGPTPAAGVRGIDWDKDLEGQVVEKYRLTNMLGKGGFGVVSAAVHTLIGRKVAIKLLRPDLGAEKSFLDRFRREAEVSANLQHPNLITIHDYGEVPGACFIVMEYIEGETLGDRLRSRKFFPPGEAYEILKPALEGIALAHARGIVHRDLKPGNIMLTKDGRVKVLDFGIAKIVTGTGPALTQTGAIIGSAHYISPEAVLGMPIDTRADLYSIGIILFEMVTGRVPFIRNNTIDYFKAHAKDAPPRLREVKPDIAATDALERVILRLLEKDPAKRYASIEELFPALEQACRGAAPRAPSQARIAPPSDATIAHVGGYAAPEEYKTPSSQSGSGERAGAGAAASSAGSATISTNRPLPGGAETIARGATGSHSALRGAASNLGKMARLELVAPPQTHWFLFATSRLRFGRAKPGTQGSENELVLRLLPCDPRVSPDNWNRTSEISGQHGELVVQGGFASILDKSSKGTWLDGRKLAKGQAQRLPDTFRLGVAGVLDLEGRVFPGGGRPAEAVRLTRIGNWDHDVYVWVIARAEVGPGKAIETPGADGDVRNESESLVASFQAVMGGEATVGGVQVRVGGGGAAEQVDRKFPC